MIEEKYQHTLKKEINYQIGIFIDRLVAPQIDPARTLAISGFWRSGTTWLHEALASVLNAKTLFEPFHPYSKGYKDLVPDLNKNNRNKYELFLPYWDASGSNQSKLEAFYTRALNSSLPGITQRILRKNMWEARKPRVVVKFTRAQLSLTAATNKIGFPAIHVQRDPRAIAASVVMAKSWNWIFEHLDLEEQLLQPEDGRRQYFEQWRDLILSSASKPITIKVALYWVLLERFLSDQMQSSQSKIQVIGYEDLLQDSVPKLATLLEKLDFGKNLSINEADLELDSFSTSGSRSNIASQERIQGWQDKLEPNIVTEIERLTIDLGLGHTLYDN